MTENVKHVYETVNQHISQEIVGKKNVIDLAVITLLCNGHMLLDDVPGTGKTVLSKAFASALSLKFKRIQCVPDMLPSDIIGVNIFDMKDSEFRFQPGPVFTNILLVDEINRAMPKTQSGLLECMEERQVSVDGTTYKLPKPFMVIATQNPIETKGTYELPEAQLDRFFVKTEMGYPTHEESIEMIERKLKNTQPSPTKSISAAELAATSEDIRAVYIHRDVTAYAVSICEQTRRHSEVLLGASPRALIHLLQAAQGFAALLDRNYVLPDDVKRAAVPVLAHRLVLNNSLFQNPAQNIDVINQVLNTTPVPSEQINFSRR